MDSEYSQELLLNYKSQNPLCFFLTLTLPWRADWHLWGRSWTPSYGRKNSWFLKGTRTAQRKQLMCRFSLGVCVSLNLCKLDKLTSMSEHNPETDPYGKAQSPSKTTTNESQIECGGNKAQEVKTYHAVHSGTCSPATLAPERNPIWNPDTVILEWL